MKKQILEELNGIKYLFNYNRGKVISEQEQFESEDIDFEEIDIDDENGDEDINYLKGEFNEEYDDYEEYDYMVDPNAEEMLPSFDSSSSSGKYLGMAKPMGDMDTRTPEEREKTKTPSTPYKPKPGPKPDPKARKRKGDMPDWLTFDELGIDFE